MHDGTNMYSLIGYGYEKGTKKVKRNNNDLSYKRYKTVNENDWKYYVEQQGRYVDESDFKDANSSFLKFCKVNWINATFYSN